MKKRFKDEGLVVIGIGFQDTRENITDYLKDAGLGEITFAYDGENKAAEAYGIVYVAASVFIDKKGIVKKRLPSGFNEAELLKEIYHIIN